MGYIRKLKEKNLAGYDSTENDVYPVTSEESVFDYNSNNIKIYNTSVNLSVAFPTSGNNGTELYTLDQAVTLIDSIVPEDRKRFGFVIQFIPLYGTNLVSYTYNSKSLFNNTESWSILYPISTTLSNLDYNSLSKSLNINTSLYLTSIISRISLFDSTENNATIEESGTVNYTQIVFIKNLNVFAAKYLDKYYLSWESSGDYDSSQYYNNGSSALRKVFRQSNGALWYFTESQLLSLYEPYPLVVLWSGNIVQDAEILALSTVGQDSSKIVFILSKNTFAYSIGLNLYVNEWINRRLFLNRIYILSDNFNPLFTRNYFSGIDNSIWIATSSNTISLINATPPKDNKLYGLRNGVWEVIE